MRGLAEAEAIFINEQMAVTTYKILKASYRLKQYGYLFVRQKGGVVYARLNEECY